MKATVILVKISPVPKTHILKSIWYIPKLLVYIVLVVYLFVWRQRTCLIRTWTLKGESSLQERHAVLLIAMVQFSLHAYSIFTLRASNEKFLNGGSMEQQWGFGQIAAMLLLGANLVVLLNGLQGVSHSHLMAR